MDADRLPDPAVPYPHGDTMCAGCHTCQPGRFPNTSAAYCGCRVCNPTGAAPVSAAVPPAEPRDLMGELTALADAFYRVVEYLRAPDPPITESEAAEIADAALFRAEKVIDRGR